MTQFEVGNYSYLIPAIGPGGVLSALLVSGEEFSLLELEHPIPQESPWGPILYNDIFYTDKERALHGSCEPIPANTCSCWNWATERRFAEEKPR